MVDRRAGTVDGENVSGGQPFGDGPCCGTGTAPDLQHPQVRLQRQRGDDLGESRREAGCHPSSVECGTRAGEATEKGRFRKIGKRLYLDIYLWSLGDSNS